MAVVFEDFIQLWLKLNKKKPEPYVNPDLDPVLLVPGIAGSILNAVDDASGKEERVWVRILGADSEFCTKLWSRFDPSTGKTVSMNPKTRIIVPEDRYGLYAIDILDPDMIIGRDCVYYFHDMIEEMLKWGFQEGKTLFGFGYDFRQSNRFQETLDLFSAKLESVYTASGGKKINIITHSMGGLLVKCFMCLHSEVFEKYVQSWIAIAAPFRGAPGYITTSLLNGMSFVEGWEQNFFISKWSMHQLLIECPSIYELMGSSTFNWKTAPQLQIWTERNGGDGELFAMLESYERDEIPSIMKEALAINKVKYDGVDLPLPFNTNISKWAHETQRLLSSAKLPSTVKFYNIYGTHNATPHSVCYGTEDAPVTDLVQLPLLQAKYVYVDGDGTVPLESAQADGLDAVARVGVPGDHRGIICDRHVFRILRHWLKAGDWDPFYNPIIDYVILPTAFEIETHKDQGMRVTTIKEEWEIISEDDEDGHANPAEHLAGSISASYVGKDKSCVEEHTSEEKQQLVTVRAVTLAAIRS